MFSTLSERLSRVVKNISGQGKLTETNIKDTLREIRNALIEADVALPVIQGFIEQSKQKALGQEVLLGVNPGQSLVKIFHDELVHIMGEATTELNFNTQTPAIILMAGLQGSGKTTTVAKLARKLKEENKKSVMVTSADVYRPAAIQQLETLANEIQVSFHPSTTDQDPVDIANGAIKAAKTQACDVLIVDTAGRLHVDETMMTNIHELHQAINPIETLFVVDSMTGQDAANTAAAFNDALPLTGVVLTKTDGDARGGAALSVRMITGKPIKFMGSGEKTDALEIFHPDRVASRILGMGDILTLVEEVEREVDEKQAKKMAKKMRKGQFDLDDLRQQLSQMQNMGGVHSLLGKIPGMSGLPNQIKDKVDDKQFKQAVVIIDSMTLKERRFPDLIRGSRKRRIAAGSGTAITDVNRVLKLHKQMEKMMKRFSNPASMAKMMKQMQSMMPPGSMPPDGF